MSGAINPEWHRFGTTGKLTPGHWLHVGNWEAGPRVAAIASVIESSKRLGINPREYLADVLPRLANGTTSEVPSLTPYAWLRARSGHPTA
ncbi:MAG: hypothetical protein RLZZ179_3215 [Verrucomicrobiota bacterium]|jgi:hypothetical protein